MILHIKAIDMPLEIHTGSSAALFHKILLFITFLEVKQIIAECTHGLTCVPHGGHSWGPTCRLKWAKFYYRVTFVMVGFTIYMHKYVTGL